MGVPFVRAADEAPLAEPHKPVSIFYDALVRSPFESHRWGIGRKAGASSAGVEQYGRRVGPLVLEADGLMRSNDWGRAAVTIQRALDLAPTNAALLFRAAQVETAVGNYFQAEKKWKRLVEQDPKNTAYLVGLGGVQYRNYERAEAETSLRQALQLDPENIVARYNLALLLVERGDRASARALLIARTTRELGQCCAWLSDEWDVLDNRFLRDDLKWMAYFLFTNGSEASPEWRERSSAQCRDLCKKVSLLLWQANVAMQQDQWTQALKALESAEQAGVTAPALALDKAYTLYYKGRIKSALKELEAMTTRYDQPAYIWTMLGLLRLEAGQAAEALEPLQTAIQKDPSDVEALFGLGCAEALARNFKAATKHLIAAKQRDPAAFRGLVSRQPGYLKQIEQMPALENLIKP